nr:MAG TPA: protein of unknown function (DUF4376) [Caudoviricetes sp.]
MKAEYAQRPPLFSVVHLPSSRCEVLLRENITEESKTVYDGPEARELTYYTADEYCVTVSDRADIEQKIQSEFSEWIQTAKEKALSEAKARKLAEVSAVCTNTIYGGVDITIGGNIEHFSLTEKDQINISQAMAVIKSGAAEFPYHSDGNICRMFTAEEIIELGNAATAFVLYHTTMCNHLNMWIRRCESDTEVSAIYYGTQLPEDLAESFNGIIGAGV